MIGVEDVEQSCLECGRFCVNRRALGNHVARAHSNVVNLEVYTLKHKLSGIAPLCACGCGATVRWHKTRYRFNDYLNGHNDAGGYVKSGYKQMPEQISHRIACIKKAYSGANRDELVGKISSSLKRAWQDPAKSKRMKDAQNDSWSDPARRVAHSASQKEAWAKDHDARVARVFTPEFRKKISMANMKRDCKRTSAAELRMVEQLKQSFPDVEAGKWFNFEERTWCADAWIPSLGAIVEHDGLYWHGLDRSTDFTYDQIVNITNDIGKNLLARARGLTLLRVKEGTDVSSARTLDDLVELAHHAVVGGTVVKEGTFRIHEKVPLIPRETLLLSPDIVWREQELLPALVDLYRCQVAYHGWFYLEPVDEPLSGILAMLGTGTTVDAGTTWLKSFVRSYWDVDPGPVKAFYAENALMRVLRYRLGLNDSKPYTYKLSDGSSMTTKETFDINIVNVRRGFIVQRCTVSWFKPSWAVKVYKALLKDVDVPVVWDPSVGFSARLLGFASAFKQGRYVGTDPAEPMLHDARRLRELLLLERPQLQVDLIASGSENYVPVPGTLDLVFTSPPYFKVEKYLDEPGQCWRDFPTIEGWARGYLRPTIVNAFIGLKPGRMLALNVFPDLEELIVATALDVGFERSPADDVQITLRLDHFARKNGASGSKYENVLVFRKPAI